MTVQQNKRNYEDTKPIGTALKLRKLKHSTFHSFFLSMLYICQTGFIYNKKCIVVKDELLSRLLPPLHHIIRFNSTDPFISVVLQNMYPAKMKHLTKYVLITKKMLSRANCQIEAFKIPCQNFKDGNLQVRIQSNSIEIKPMLLK